MQFLFAGQEDVPGVAGAVAATRKNININININIFIIVLHYFCWQAKKMYQAFLEPWQPLEKI